MTTSPTQQTPTTRPPTAARNSSATAGFWLAALGMLAGFVPVVGFAVTLPALALSYDGRKRYRDGREASEGPGGVGLVLAWIGTMICTLTTTLAIVAAANAPAAPVAVEPVASPAPVVAPATVLLTVPNVVGMGDLQARDVLRAAGFTNVVLGPSTGPVPGVAAGTVTTQLPNAAALASAGDPIVLGEAAAPPVPAPVVPQSAPASEAAPTTEAVRPFVAADPDVDVDRPFVPAPAAPRGSGDSGSGSGGSGGSASYANCSAARAAGVTPLHVGDPGYSGELDRDGDGVACE